jgi:hypothetical protein
LLRQGWPGEIGFSGTQRAGRSPGWERSAWSTLPWPRLDCGNPFFHRASSRPKNHRGRRDTPTSHTGKDHGLQPSSIRNGRPKKTIDYIDTWRHVISEHVGPPRCDIATLGGIRGRAAQIFLRGPQVKETRRVDSQTRPTSPDISHLRKRRNTISKLSENGTRTKQTQGSIFRWIENKSVSTIVPPISRPLSAVIHFHRRHSAQLTG